MNTTMNLSWPLFCQFLVLKKQMIFWQFLYEAELLEFVNMEFFHENLTLWQKWIPEISRKVVKDYPCLSEQRFSFWWHHSGCIASAKIPLETSLSRWWISLNSASLQLVSGSDHSLSANANPRGQSLLSIVDPKPGDTVMLWSM